MGNPQDNTIRREKWLVLGALAAVLVVGSCQLSAQLGQPAFKPMRVARPFPAWTKFPVKAVREVGDMLAANELVLGVTVGKEARAYPINMLTGPQREILNDTLGGKAIAATW